MFIQFRFIFSNKISEDEALKIKRTSTFYTKGRVDVYQFVATRLKPLYKVLNEKELDDIFDIAIWLRGKPIVTLAVQKEDTEYFKEANKNNIVKKMDEAYWAIRRMRSEHLELHSRRNWSACK